jgi:hypothetical protein
VLQRFGLGGENHPWIALVVGLGFIHDQVGFGGGIRS